MKQEILKELTTEWMGKNILYYQSIDSTQKEAYRIIRSGEKLENGTVIIAEEQTAGIGTQDRKWYSGKKENISFTFILYPNCSVKKIEGFTTKIAECFVKTIQKLYSICLEIKYPNDLVYNGKKVGGILTQSTTNKEVVKQMVIGIGINANGIIFPKKLENIAISLKMITGKEISREKVIAEFFNAFEKQYEAMISD